MSWVSDKKKAEAHFFSSLTRKKVLGIARWCEGRKSYSGFEELGWLKFLEPIESRPDPDLTERVANLAPSLAAELNFNSPLDLVFFVNAVVGSAALTKIASQSSKRPTSSRTIFNSLNKIERIAKTLQNDLKSAKLVRSAIKSVYSDLADSKLDVDLDPVEILILIIDVLKIDISMTPGPGRYILRSEVGARPKINAIENAAYICKRFRGPKFVTTPGSAFSYFASLIYEIATGDADESMQGAIIRFGQGDRPSMCAGYDGEDFSESDDLKDYAYRYHLYRSELNYQLSKSNGRDLEQSLLLLRRALAEAKDAEAALRSTVARARSDLGEGPLKEALSRNTRIAVAKAVSDHLADPEKFNAPPDPT